MNGSDEPSESPDARRGLPARPARPPPLDYAPPEPSRTSAALQCMLGVVLSCAALLGSAFVCISTMNVLTVVLVPLIMAVLLGVVAHNLGKERRTLALAGGIWIGIGVGLLLDGLCWAVVVGWGGL